MTDDNVQNNDQGLDQDIEALQELQESFADESEEIAALAESTQKEFEAASAPAFEFVEGAAAKLEELEKKANEEENAGQIQKAKEEITGSAL